MKRWAVFAGVLGISFAVGVGTAYAKATTGATIEGGGTTVQVADRPGRGGLSELVDVTGMWSYSGDAAIAFEPEPAVRGPAYIVRYRVDSDTFRQELYPATSSGSLIYTPPGQVLFGIARRGGWTESGVNLSLFLRAYGITVPAAAATAPPAPAASAPAAPAPAYDGASSEVPIAVPFAALALLLPAGAALLWRRRGGWRRAVRRRAA